MPPDPGNGDGVGTFPELLEGLGVGLLFDPAIGAGVGILCGGRSGSHPRISNRNPTPKVEDATGTSLKDDATICLLNKFLTGVFLSLLPWNG